MAAALVVAGLASLGAARPQAAAVSERGRMPQSAQADALGVAKDSGAVVSLAVATPRSETCRDARIGLAFYTSRRNRWVHKMGAGASRTSRAVIPTSCPHIRRAAKFMRSKAAEWRARYEKWAYEYDWRSWMPDKWQRIGACETGYGKRPGDFHWNSGPYQGAFGFAVASWDAFRLPGYPSEAYLATPRQQLNVALRIHARYGYSGWGCGSA